MDINKPHPPRWADKFLEWYCRIDLLEEIQGDAYELYYRRAKEKKRKADLFFIWNVFRFFRFKNISKVRFTTPGIMIKSYLLIGFRNALRNGVTSFINIFGLSLGIAGAITIFVFADQFFHMDDFQEKADRIYEVTNVINRDKELVTLSDVPISLAPAMQEDFPGIEKAVRIELVGGSVKSNEKVFSENIYCVDNTFFDVFNFPFIEGNKQALSAKNNVVLTKAMAEKYFANQEAIGQPLSIKFSNNKIIEFTVSAVVDLPGNNSMYFNFLIPMDVFLDLKLKETNNWNYLTDGTFILMKPGHTISEVSGLMQKYTKLQNESSPEWMTEKFTFYHFPELSSRSYEIESGLVGSGHPQGVYAMAAIAFMLLLLACFNYMNISVATVTTRLKEIGIRKVIGGTKKEIVQQFVVENILLCTLSVALGFFISYMFFMPWLNALIANKIPFAFSSSQTMILFFSGMLLFIVLISGIYPAVYISSFKPIVILKGKEKFGQRSKFSRILLTTQFILAFTTIVGCFVFIDNSLYLKNKDWGYDHSQNILVPVNTSEQYYQMRDKVASNKNVVSFAGSANHIGYWNTRSSVKKLDEQFEIVNYQVGFDYLETLNVRLKQGRSFDKTIQSDKVESVIVNENFVKTMGWEKALNQTFEYDSVKRVVVGVVSNFHYDDFYRGILPVVFTIAPEKDFRYLSVKVAGGQLSETENWLKNTWKEIAPDDPYEGIPQVDVFANWANNNKTDMKILSFIAGLAIILACLGLFGLVSYNITRRLKEFSVRKVFGANLLQIFKLMNRDYVWILGIAFCLGAPAGFFLMDNLIQHIYADPQSAGFGPFIIAMMLMFLTVAITIGTQMRRVLKENPAKTLRNE